MNTILILVISNGTSQKYFVSVPRLHSSQETKLHQPNIFLREDFRGLKWYLQAIKVYRIKNQRNICPKITWINQIENMINQELDVDDFTLRYRSTLVRAFMYILSDMATTSNTKEAIITLNWLTGTTNISSKVISQK